MRQIRRLGACLAVALVVGAIAGVGTASATEYPLTGLPEVGRCKNVGTGGNYMFKGCVVPNSKGEGKWEWFPGPEGEGKWEVPQIFEGNFVTSGGVKIGCGPSELVGNWQDGKTTTIKLALKGCLQQVKNKPCQTDPKSGSEIVLEGSGKIDFISGKGQQHPKVGLDFVPSSGTFSCGGPPGEPLPEVWKMTGSVIGQIKPIDKMKTEYKLIYVATNGGVKQNPEKFEEGVPDTLIAERIEGAEPPKAPEQTGLTMREEHRTILYEGTEALEIKAK